jgi:DNA-binding HxlR family transcriptional regulator
MENAQRRPQRKGSRAKPTQAVCTLESDHHADNCPVAIVSEILGDPCTLIIVRDLCGGPKRYGELTSSQPHTSTRTLTKKLRLLEEGGHIVRKVFDEHPPHVEYHLSPRGKGLRPIITAMRKYGAGDEHYS